MANSKVSSGHAEWERGRDLEDHQFDLAQPYNSDGSINVDFARVYPDKAKAIFSDDELNKAMRK